MRFDAALIRAFEHHVQFEEVPTATVNPIFLSVKDVDSGTVNNRLTPGGMVGLRGRDLKFNPLAEDEGIFLLPTNGQGGNVIKMTKFLDNSHSRLSFSVPTDLAPGATYMLEVCVRKRGCKALRSSVFETELIIA